MPTQCSTPSLTGEPLGSRDVVAGFDGGHITSDAGGLLPRELEAKFRFVEQFARCFSDHRDPELIEHTLPELLKQRIYGLCLGYEDLNDHDRLRHDPLLAVLAGKADPLGQDRLRPQDRGKPLAGKSTLNRLELTPVRANAASRYKKIVAHLDAMQAFFVEAFLQQHAVPPERVILDLDTTDFALHGHQLGRFFHGYYDAYCVWGDLARSRYFRVRPDVPQEAASSRATPPSSAGSPVTSHAVRGSRLVRGPPA